MLPPGIYLWKSGAGGIASPATPADVAATSDLWADDIDSHGPWSEVVDVSGVGTFHRSAQPCDDIIVIVGNCVSTMEVCRFLVDHGVIGEWDSVIGVEQSSGRGQLRRHWVSPAGNLHVSLVMPAAPQKGVWAKSQPQLLSLLCGYFLAQAFGMSGTSLQIKWPNDLLQGGLKVGGMLIEERDGVDILGFGMNLAECPGDDMMREDRSVPAGILQTTEAITPLLLWRTLVNRGKTIYIVLLGEMAPSEFVTALADRLAWRGQRIRVHERGEDFYYADIEGISPEGGLIIRRAQGREVLFSGSITPA